MADKRYVLGEEYKRDLDAMLREWRQRRRNQPPVTRRRKGQILASPGSKQFVVTGKHTWYDAEGNYVAVLNVPCKPIALDDDGFYVTDTEAEEVRVFLPHTYRHLDENANDSPDSQSYHTLDGVPTYGAKIQAAKHNGRWEMLGSYPGIVGWQERGSTSWPEPVPFAAVSADLTQPWLWQRGYRAAQGHGTTEGDGRNTALYFAAGAQVPSTEVDAGNYQQWELFSCSDTPHLIQCATKYGYSRVAGDPWGPLPDSWELAPGLPGFTCLYTASNGRGWFVRTPHGLLGWARAKGDWYDGSTAHSGGKASTAGTVYSVIANPCLGPTTDSAVYNGTDTIGSSTEPLPDLTVEIMFPRVAGMQPSVYEGDRILYRLCAPFESRNEVDSAKRSPQRVAVGSYNAERVGTLRVWGTAASTTYPQGWRLFEVGGNDVLVGYSTAGASTWTLTASTSPTAPTIPTSRVRFIQRYK
jgi:hypothetical protein